MTGDASSFRLDARWGVASGMLPNEDVCDVAIDSRDEVYVFARTGKLPIRVFSSDGTYLRGWGSGHFVRPHGLSIGRDDSVIVTDEGAHRVRQYDRDGTLLLEIATPDGDRPDGEPFNRCTHTTQLRDGTIYVADGYANARIHAFDRAGNHLHSWGRWGSDPGEFAIPHNICSDDEDRIYVADRENHRIQVFDRDGKIIAQIGALHRPCALAIDSLSDRLVVGELGPAVTVLAGRPGLGRAVKFVDREGGARATLASNPSPNFIAPHGIAVDSCGNIYVAELANAQWHSVFPNVPAPVGLPTLRKFVRSAT